MASAVVQFREPVEAVEWLRAKGINPNDFAREAFERQLRRIRAEEKWEKIWSRGIRLDEPGWKIIRRERESH